MHTCVIRPQWAKCSPFCPTDQSSGGCKVSIHQSPLKWWVANITGSQTSWQPIQCHPSYDIQMADDTAWMPSHRYRTQEKIPTECFLTLWVSEDLARPHWPIWKTSSGKWIFHWKAFALSKLKERNMANFVVNTAPADGLAPWGARPSAGTVMMKFGSVCLWPALEGRGIPVNV